MVYSITVTFNPDLLLFKRQIESLKNQVACVIIVDNKSSNIVGIKNLLEEEVEQLTYLLIHNETNQGLGAAQNTGIKVAIANKASHVLMLDQDSILDNGFIINLLQNEETLKSQNIAVGAIGPIYYNERTNEIYPITRYKGPFIERIKPSSSPVEASFLIASGCLINMEVIERVGFMNEDLFIDYIDVEWSFRAKKNGYKLYASPAARMKHTIGDNRTSVFGRSISVHSPLRRYYLYRNSIYMIKNKSISVGYKIREITFNTLRLAVFLVLSQERRKYLKYSIYGFLDGFKGIVGKCPHNF